jgi:hypothetical protein
VLSLSSFNDGGRADSISPGAYGAEVIERGT